MSETQLPARLIKGLQADYRASEYTGQNTSGLKVYHDNVLIMVDQCAIASAGGVYLTDDQVEKMTMASESGAICALGFDAFKYHEDGTVWEGEKPQIGDRVYFIRYAGVVARGRDGSDYRIMGHRSVVAGLDNDEQGSMQ